MKQISLLVLLFLIGPICGRPAEDIGNSQPLTSRLWVHLDSEWHASSPETGSTAWAYSRILRFLPNHEFSMVACILLRGSTATSMSPGDGQVIYLGRWKEEMGVVAIEYVKVDETIHEVDGFDAPFQHKKAGTVDFTADEIRLDGLLYTGSWAPDLLSHDELIHRVRIWNDDKLKKLFAN